MIYKLRTKTKTAFLRFVDHCNIRKLKNIHLNKCGFVIGNGPSLDMADLTFIRGQVSIASNKIYLAYDSTPWRPTYYSIIDSFVAKQISPNIPNHQTASFYLNGLQPYIQNSSNTFFIKQISEGHFDGNQYLNYNPGFSSNILQGLFAGECVTYFNVQLLAYMGCNPIVLTGVDFSFTVPSDSSPDNSFGEIYNQPAAQNHFHKDYRPVGEIWTRPNLKEQQLSFTYAANYLHSKGKILLNASRATALQDVPRVNLLAIAPFFI
jgi:hypothetical protein